jgi:hypothetical protein
VRVTYIGGRLREKIIALWKGGLEGRRTLCSDLHVCYCSAHVNITIGRKIIHKWHVACIQ